MATANFSQVRIIFGLLLIALAFGWAWFWCAGAAMTSETGVPNSMTWAALAVAALALIPLAGGIYLIVRFAWRITRYFRS